MRHFGSVLCFLVLAAASHGVSVSAQQAGGCTTPPPFSTWICVNGGWVPPSTPPEPTPPAPTPVQVISVGETVAGTLSPNTIDSTGFHPGVFEILYELTAPSDGFLTVQLSFDPAVGYAGLLLEDVVGSWPPPSIATLEVDAGRTYHVSVSTSPWDLYSSVPFVLTTFISPEAPAPVISCSGFWPGTDWVCVNGGWVPPDHPLAQPGAPPPPPPPTPPAPAPPPPGAIGCATVQPVSTWVCVNGGWVPPDHPLALSAPSTPPPPPPPAPSGGCTTPDPFISIPGLIGVCIDGGWRPIARGGGQQ